MCVSKSWRWRITLTLALLASAASAQQQPTREQEQLRRLRLQVQQLQQEQTARQDAAQRAAAEAGSVKTQLIAAQAELRQLQASATQQTQSAQALQKELGAARDGQTALQAQLEQAQSALQDSGKTVAGLRAEAATLQQRLAQHAAAQDALQSRHNVQAQGLQLCIANNQALGEIGADLLQRYRNKGLAEVLAHNEPFLQLQRVALDNLTAGYQDKLDQLALKAGGARPEPPRAP